MEIIKGIFTGIGEFLISIPSSIGDTFSSANSAGDIYTTFARWIFIFLAFYILLKSIKSLLKSNNAAEVWAYLNTGPFINIPLKHWENVIGRAGSCDVQIDDMSVSRAHGTLTRDNDGIWKYMDLGSKNGAVLNGTRIEPNTEVEIRTGDSLVLGKAKCMLFPISIEERRNNIWHRTRDTVLVSPWASLIAITVFQVMTVIQLMIGLDKRYDQQITISYMGLCGLMWGYVIVLRSMKRKGFEMELIAFFLCTLSLAAVATRFPNQVFKQFIAICLGVGLFFFMCTWLRELPRTIKIKKIVYALAVVLFLINVIFGESRNGNNNWISIGSLTIQPSELVKLAFIWVGAASLDELFDKKNTLIFTGFSLFCFACLAAMGDLGTATIFFVTFLIISFLRSGDLTKIIVIAGVAGVAGMVALRFKGYALARILAWGHMWEPQYINAREGYQITRNMTASASGGFVGLGAGKGWLHELYASETDLVFGLITEEWGLIIAVLTVLAILTLSIFAYRSILNGRSTYYTIAACSAMSIFIFQTMLNVLGSLDLLPFMGVAFPFVSYGGTSMMASWGLLAFLKSADTRQNASFAVSLKDRGMGEEDRL
ncbi:MAG: FtsW/RodA/SpoVE family cell cycle protein [Hornefia sp.]|nr:FtsW/RodA/SpoVE family cell cycle protein [Hornefia sp.]